MAERIGLDSPSAIAAGIPLSTRDDLAVLYLPNLLRIEPKQLRCKGFNSNDTLIKIKPTKVGLIFMAERIGLEPMDR